VVRRLLSPWRSTPDLSRNRRSKVLAQHFSGMGVNRDLTAWLHHFSCFKNCAD